MPAMLDIDFLPDSIRRRRKRRVHLIRQGNLLVIVLVGLVTLGVLKQRTIARAQAQQALQQDQKANFDAELAMRRQYEQEMAQLLVRKHIDEQLGSRMGATEVLKELQRVQPPTVTLMNLTLEAVEETAKQEPVVAGGVRPIGSGPQRKSETVRRVKIQLSGMAPQDVAVATFIANLSASYVYESVTMGYAKTVQFDRPIYIEAGKPPRYERRAGREFQASCYVAP